MSSLTYILLLFCVCGNALSNVSSAFEEFLVPKYFPKAPEKELCVEYPDARVDLGNVLTSDQVALPPVVTFDTDDDDSYYTLIMVDVEAPYPDIISLQVLHWWVANIQNGDVSKGDVFAPYLSPTPAPGSKPHHYVQLLYKQCGPISVMDAAPTIVKRIGLFSIEEFTENYDLSDPLYGNFFLGKLARGAVGDLLNPSKGISAL